MHAVPSEGSLKTIRFETEMLPNWAQLLDTAARLCSVSKETRVWFSRFTNSPGVDDARTIIAECQELQAAIRQRKDLLAEELRRTRHDEQPLRIIAAWEYSLDTMIQSAQGAKTCSWRIDGKNETTDGDYGGGEITLRRV